LRGGFFGRDLFCHIEERAENAGAGFFHFDFGSEWAVDGIERDFFHRFNFGCGFTALLGFGEVEAGDLEAVEEQAGPARVDVVGGYATKNFADGVLDGAAVFRQGQFEGGWTAAALTWVFDGATGGVVVVTKIFVAQACTAAAASVGEDVAALIAFLCLDCGALHGISPLPT
jgi:hypothetical protein